MKEWMKNHQRMSAVVIAFLGTISMKETMAFRDDGLAYSNSFISVLLFLFSAILLKQVFEKLDFKDKRGVVLSLLFSALFSFSLLVGKQLQTVENCDFKSAPLWINLLVLSFYFQGLILFLLQFFKKQQEKWKENAGGERDNLKFSWKSMMLKSMLLFVCWLPVFLAFYPGAFVYDAQDEFVQVASREFTTHHPLIHVLLLGGSVCFGNKFFDSYNLGIAIYTIFQMSLLAFILAYSLEFIKRYLWVSEKQRKVIQFGGLIFYGFFPIFPMYAVCSSKDTLFHGFLLLLILCMLEGYLRRNKGKNNLWIGILLSSVCVLLFRKNAVYAYFLMMMIFLIVTVMKKNSKWMKQMFLCMLFALLIYKGVDESLVRLVDASDIENQELLTVPIQQLARTYCYDPDVFSKEDLLLLFEYIPEEILKVYDADLSDLLKANFSNQRYSKNPKEFLGLWFRYGCKKPLTYINAWLMTSYGYWYPDTLNNVYGGQDRFTFQYGESSYFGFETELPGERESKIPWLEEQYRKISLEIYQQKVPVISMLFSQGFLFWFFAFVILSSIYRKEYFLLLPLGLVFLIWATFLLGPTFLVRYGLIFWFLLPVEIQLLWGCTNDFSQNMCYNLMISNNEG